MINFLKEERNRLGYNQSYVADYISVAVPTLSNYEQGKRSPDLSILIKMAEIGYDMQFVITGKRDSNHLTNEDKFLLEKFKAADKNKQAAVWALLLTETDTMLKAVAGEVGNGKGTTINVNKNKGQVAKKIINK